MQKDNRIALKSLSHIGELVKLGSTTAGHLEESEVVTFHSHSQKMDLDKDEEMELFQKVLKFIQHFLTNNKQWKEVEQHFNKYSSRSSQKINSQKQNAKLLSFKKMTFGSKICFDGEVVKKGQNANGKDNTRAVRGNNKKISIFVTTEDYPSSSSNQSMSSEELISETKVRSIRSIQIPNMEMNLQTIALIYDTPQPFLINLSLCIFARYCLRTKRQVKLEESAWVLVIATIIAYKIYYDEQIEGLLDCFMGIIKVPKCDLIDLERCFLSQIDYCTIIRNYDYYFMMLTLISMPIQEMVEK